MSALPETMTRLLVVDDSRLMLKAAQKMLGGEFDIVTAGDGIEAWAMLESDSSIQVVFTDLNMPRSDGYDLLQKIRSATETGLQNLPVIVVTGTENDEGARMQALDMGATDFITKPFTSIDLLARARAHAKYQRITQQLQAQITLDTLTGLANKSGFIERLRQDIAYARRHEQDLTLVRMEIEGLREVFLRRGKEHAEALVVHVAQRVRERIRKEDTAGRVGLGGFGLSMPAGKADGIAGMISRLCAELAAQPIEVDGETVLIGLRTAVFGPEASLWPSAEGALGECQEMLDSGRDLTAAAPTSPPVAPAPPVAAPAPAAVQASEAMSVVAPPEPAPEPAPEPTAQAVSSPASVAVAPLAIDPILEQVRQGHSEDALAKMPQILQGLVPLLRLLSAGQRAQLIRFLQQLDGA